MQEILCLILLAACFELSTARPRLQTVGVMASVWPRSGPHQTGFSATLLHHTAAHPSPSNLVPPPCSLELRCPRGMNPPLEAAVPTREARAFFASNIQRPAGEKSQGAEKASWSISTQASQDNHYKVQHQLARNSSSDPQELITPKNQNMLRRWKRGSPRAKRSVTQGTAVQYTDFKDVKFRMQGSDPLYLMPTSSGNSMALNTHHVNHTCFRAHMFVELATNSAGGLLVMLQAHTGTGSYLQSNSSGSLSLVSSEAGVTTVTQIDNRFFRLISYIGDSTVRIKHITTNLHLQASSNGVSLVSTDPLAAEGMQFYEYSCSTT